jgi:hypothetical protein
MVLNTLHAHIAVRNRFIKKIKLNVEIVIRGLE